MKFEEYWEKYKVQSGLLLRTKCDVAAGWNAALEYGASKTSTNKQRIQFICCLGSEHKCMMNVNNGYCADGAGACQYKVKIN